MTYPTGAIPGLVPGTSSLERTRLKPLTVNQDDSTAPKVSQAKQMFLGIMSCVETTCNMSVE
jgi:hypothetical protein